MKYKSKTRLISELINSRVCVLTLNGSPHTYDVYFERRRSLSHKIGKIHRLPLLLKNKAKFSWTTGQTRLVDKSVAPTG